MTNLDQMFILSLLTDFREEWGLDITDEDCDYFRSRSEYTWLASVLPELDDILLSGLEDGFVSYRDLPLRNGFPRILPGLWSRIFGVDRKILSTPCTESIFALRQISRTYKKVFEVSSDESVEAAIQQFVDTDNSLFSGSVPASLCEVSSVLHGKHLRAIGRAESFRFNHGPGATAEKLDSVARWDFPVIRPSIASRFDIADFFPFYREDWPSSIEEASSRLVAVPKTFMGPRLISIEPCASMYTQQGVLRALGSWMNSNRQLNMLRQEPNQDMAREGSVSGDLATIDLSEASDRVSLSLVKGLFRYVPDFVDLILDLRTPTVQLPSGEVHVLKKYAPMGSALTFPVEMLVFHTLVIYGICRADGDFSPENIRRWGRSLDVIVYGDDIIIPARYNTSVTQCLQEFGLKVNRLKSYSKGPFRESCGADWVSGAPVNPVYLRQRLPRSRRDADKIISVAATSVLLRDRGLHHASIFLSALVESLIGPTGSGSGAITVGYPSPTKERFNKHLQRHEVYAPTAVPARERTKGSEMAQLAYALHIADKSPVIDPYRISHHGRPSRAFISRRWVQAI